MIAVIVASKVDSETTQHQRRRDKGVIRGDQGVTADTPWLFEMTPPISHQGLRVAGALRWATIQLE